MMLVSSSWATVAYITFDIHTKSVVGFYLGFEPPSYLSVSLALENAILPKDYVKELYPDVKMNGHATVCQNTLLLIIVQNLTVKILLVPVKTYVLRLKRTLLKTMVKGSVERYFRTINNKLLSGIPGKSFSNIFARGDYNPQKMRLLPVRI